MCHTACGLTIDRAGALIPVLDIAELYCHCEYTSSKLERLQIRVQPEEKRRLEAAAAAAHLSVSAFVLAAAEWRAEELIAGRRVLSLSPEGSGVLTEALERPARVNERLAAALGGPSGITWIA